jgi:hypothetical protein
MRAKEALLKNYLYDPQRNLYDALPEMKLLSNNSTKREFADAGPATLGPTAASAQTRHWRMWRLSAKCAP